MTVVLSDPMNLNIIYIRDLTETEALSWDHWRTRSPEKCLLREDFKHNKIRHSLLANVLQHVTDRLSDKLQELLEWLFATKKFGLTHLHTHTHKIFILFSGE